MAEILHPEPPPAWRDHAAELRARTWAAADALLGYPMLKRRFRDVAGWEPDLERPHSFTEKVTWRKIRDRDPRFPVVADKLRVRSFAAERLGRVAAGALFPRLHLAASRAEEIDLAALPPAIAIKANHASGWNLFLRPGHRFDAGRVRRLCAHWLRRSYAPWKHEWAYARIPRRILVEDLLAGPAGSSPPDDIKLHMCNGRCHRITLARTRGGRRLKRFYTAAWSDHPVQPGSGETAPPRHRPERLADMVATAERLSAGFDYIRVDFLDLGPRFSLTELTVYPASGVGSVARDRDILIGADWRNPRWQAA